MRGNLADIDMTLHRHAFQSKFIKNAGQTRISAFVAGLQSGKTIAGVDALAELLWVEMIQLPKQAQNAYPEVWMLSKNYSMAEVVWNAFVDRWGDMVLTNEECKKQNLYRGESNVHWLRPGPRPDAKPIRCRVRTVEDPESLRGTQNLLVCLCDESAYWREAAWLNIRGRGIVTPTRYLLTTTPKGKNWFFRLVAPALSSPDGKYTEKGVTVSAVRCRSIDNPWADPGYISDLKVKFGENYAAQELDALFVENAGIVYDFDRIIHMKRPPSISPDEYEAVVFGVDPGYGDPYAVGVWAKTANGEWWLMEEYYKPKVTTDDLVGWFQKKVDRWKPKAVYVDKRRPSDWLMLKKHLGAKVKYVGPNIEVHSETDKRVIMPQVRYCQQLLRTQKLFIDPRCLFTAEEFEQYHFKDVDERNAGENPVDWKNHTMDAMRYGICSYDEIHLRDRRQRVRSGEDLMPRIKGGRGGKPRFCSAQEYLLAMHKKMDADDKQRGGRRERVNA